MKDRCAVLLVLVVDLTVVLLDQAVDNFKEALLAGYHKDSLPVLLWVRGVGVRAILNKNVDALLHHLSLTRGLAPLNAENEGFVEVFLG